MNLGHFKSQEALDVYHTCLDRSQVGDVIELMINGQVRTFNIIEKAKSVVGLGILADKKSISFPVVEMIVDLIDLETNYITLYDEQYTILKIIKKAAL